MLTADHVDARRQGEKLVLKRLGAADLEEAATLAEAYLEAAKSHLGLTRAELTEAWGAIDSGAKMRRLAGGIHKLVEDECGFDEESELDPIVLRRELFTKATAARRTREDLRSFDRAAVIQQLGHPAEAIERALFSDLRGEHVLKTAPILNAASIVEAYELGRAQAILLKAVRVRCEVDGGSPAAVRSFFAWLKFQKLLFTTERLGSGGFAVTLDGPFSMFESVTKYGLRLALVLPALRTLERWSLRADVKWGKERTALVFELSSKDTGPARAPEPSVLSEEAQTLLAELAALPKSRWRAEVAQTLLDSPGLGVCIPDLVLRRPEAEPVYVELLGFWSRDAVWKRVELAEKGLGARIVFCASARLRVSPEVIGEDVPAALYVYKGKPSARALVEHVDRVSSVPSS